LVTPSAAAQNAPEQREDRRKHKASLRLVAQQKRQYVALPEMWLAQFHFH
jgi:predicted amidohydrolase